MTERRLVGGVLGLVLALTGCGDPGGRGRGPAAPSTAGVTSSPAGSSSGAATVGGQVRPPSGTTSASPSRPATLSGEAAQGARAMLIAAARTLGDDTLRIRLEARPQGSGTGVADPSAGVLQLRVRTTGVPATTVDLRTTRTGTYVKVDGEVGRRFLNLWVRVEEDHFPGGLGMGPARDPGNARRLLQTATRVHRDGPLRFSGRLDMTVYPTGTWHHVKALGRRAETVPFSAQVDARGRLTGLTLRLDAVQPDAPVMRLRFSDFGIPVVVPEPSVPVIGDGSRRGAPGAPGGPWSP